MSTAELLLLSGGLDSTAIASWRQPTAALTIDYGHVCADAELRAADAVCAHLGIEHHITRVDCSSIGGGLLNGDKCDIGSDDRAAEFWPFRNQLLATIAASVAYRLNLPRVVLACVASDRDRHVDGGPEFVAAISALTKMQERGIDVVAPSIDLTSQELISASGATIGLLGWTHSCHTSNLACGRCPGCLKRSRVLADVAPIA